jgi:hypothetical protein
MKLKFIRESVLKPGIDQASSYKEELTTYPVGTHLELKSYEASLNNHLQVVLASEPDKIYFAFNQHVQLITPEGKVFLDLNPNPDTRPQQGATKVPDEVRSSVKSGIRIQIPTIGTVDISDGITSKGYFTWGEATHQGERIPSAEAVANIIELAERLDWLREDVFGKSMNITSWYRPEPYNRQAGGVSNSQHLYGSAVDFWVDGETSSSLFRKLDPIWIGGLGKYYNLDWIVHVDIWPSKVRWG